MRTAFSFFLHYFLLLSAPHQYHSAYVPINIRSVRSTQPAHHHCSQQEISCKCGFCMELLLNKYKSILLFFKDRQSFLSQHTDRSADPNELSISLLYFSFPFRLLGTSRYLALHFICKLCWEGGEERQEGRRYHFYTGHNRGLHAEAGFPDTAITNTHSIASRGRFVPQFHLWCQAARAGTKLPRQQNSVPWSRPTLQLPSSSCLRRDPVISEKNQKPVSSPSSPTAWFTATHYTSSCQDDCSPSLSRLADTLQMSSGGQRSHSRGQEKASSHVTEGRSSAAGAAAHCCGKQRVRTPACSRTSPANVITAGKLWR